jgi:hypothetical protein
VTCEGDNTYEKRQLTILVKYKLFVEAGSSAPENTAQEAIQNKSVHQPGVILSI